MKKINFIIIWVLVMLSQISSFAQSNFYAVDTVREMRMYFNQPNWDEILDSLYVAGDEERLVGTLIIDGTQLDSVGIRYKGFSSVSVDRDKNPFNIKLNYTYDLDYQGYDKIKLSNVIQDPSFVRETLSYLVAGKYMPSSQANYVNLYINDIFWGVYTNVEAVNNEFLQKHYGSSDNTFVKCNPENLDLNGENSNLSNSPGIDTADYYPFYEMKSDYGWADLYSLIDTLNNSPGEIEKVLNVDRTLWLHALNYVLVNFDSYVGYAQNYYLYQDNNGRFNPIIWDLNMSFASFRLTDASVFYNGFSIAEAKVADPLQHYNSISVYPRPLMRKLFENESYRKMYIAHIRTIVEENFLNMEYETQAQNMQTLIDADVLRDTNKFYTYDDFINNLNSTVSDLVDYPGITDLMNDRAEYLSSYPGYQGAPLISELSTFPETLAKGDDVWVNATIVDASEVAIKFRYSNSELFIQEEMFDDGDHNDGSAGDGVYGIQLTDIGSTVEYYIYAENETAASFSPERAAYEFYVIDVERGLVINEFCAKNSSILADEHGDYDDWIELFNNTSSQIALGGFHLSDDNSEIDQWTFPDTIIAPNAYLLIWADKDEADEGLHANFKLSAAGEAIYLTNVEGSIVDEVVFGEQSDDITFGRFPNGTGPFNFMSPSPSTVNTGFLGVKEIDLNKNDLVIYPNPANNKLSIKFENPLDYQLTIVNINGRKVFSETVTSSSSINTFDISSLTAGFYIISLSHEGHILNKKLIVN